MNHPKIHASRDAVASSLSISFEVPTADLQRLSFMVSRSGTNVIWCMEKYTYVNRKLSRGKIDLNRYRIIMFKILNMEYLIVDC